MRRLLSIALLLPVLSWAELTPSKGDFDARVRVVDYNAADVIKLVTFYGVSTHVQFADGETIKDVAIGDEQAWQIVPRGSHLFIKPKAVKADTNVTVVTDRRVYHLALFVEPRAVKDETAWRNPNLVFSLSFRYPVDIAAAAAAAVEAKARATARTELVADVKGKLSDAKKRDENRDYWVAGSTEISPTSVRDDGRFIYLTFSNNRDMPAVYAVEADGSEALVNTNVDGNEIVVQRMLRKLTMRKGNAVACVVNKSFDLDGGRDNTSGTVAPDVQRVVKGAK